MAAASMEAGFLNWVWRNITVVSGVNTTWAARIIALIDCSRWNLDTTRLSPVEWVGTGIIAWKCVKKRFEYLGLKKSRSEGKLEEIIVSGSNEFDKFGRKGNVFGGVKNKTGLFKKQWENNFG
jgi:hypothetical protein